MDLATMRTLVRLHEDLETLDLDDALIDQWASEGYTRCIRLVKDWPFYQASETFQTVVGQSTYTLSTVKLDRIDHIQGPYGRLDPIEVLSTAKDRFYAYGDPLSGRAEAWSSWADTLYIFPEPDAVADITVLGHREPNPWPTSAASVPDMPDDFHTAIFQFVLHRALLHQDDTDRAGLEMEHFTTTMQELTSFEKEATAAQPFQLGGTVTHKRRERAVEWNTD